ncbi:MAG: helix-turn-helix domain-containing protein [Bacteroidota bacterium]
MTKTLRFLVISSNDLIRIGLCSLLKSNTSDHHQVISYSALPDNLGNYNLQINLMLVDDHLSNNESIHRVIPLIRHCCPSTRLIIIGSFLSVSYIQQILNLGADGYIYREDNLEESLNLAMKTVLSGHVFLSPRASALPYESTEPRELNQNDMKVLTLLAAGWNVQDIARRLGLVDRSIYRIRTRLRDYLGVTNNEQIVDVARRRNLLS